MRKRQIKKASLIAVGSELVDGTVVETNCSYAASKLDQKGWEVVAIEIIPDVEEIIVEALRRHTGNTDLIVTSGGLGPTYDDRTRWAVSSFLGKDLRYVGEVANRIIDRYPKDKRARIKKAMRLQALIPEDSLPIYNPIGTAIGIYTEYIGTKIICLPGIPAEFRRMFDTFLENEISVSEGVYRKDVLLIGLPETEVSLILNSIMGYFVDVKVSILPFPNIIRVVLKADENELVEAFIKEMFNSKLKEYIYSIGDKKIEEKIKEAFARKSLKVAVAESCTGGLLAQKLTSIPGASSYFVGGVVAYSNDIKINVLNVPHGVIEKHGAVSAECAFYMAKGVKELFSCDVSLSITGIAGPTGGTPQKPVGTVFVGILAEDNYEKVEGFKFNGDRNLIREWSANKALEFLWRYLT